MKIIEIKLGEKYYPEKLTKNFNPPKKLYALGDITILNDFAIAIVGTRNGTKYGENIAKSMSYNLAKYDVRIISGMAKGIDAAAHRGCILAKGKTIAVLGSGFNNIYPKENMELFKNIIKSGGVVITEYDKNMKPLPENFPKRNRIISGLSDGVLVCEAPLKSGSLITADLALDEGKEVFAIPRKY